MGSEGQIQWYDSAIGGRHYLEQEVKNEGNESTTRTQPDELWERQLNVEIFGV